MTFTRETMKSLLEAGGHTVKVSESGNCTINVRNEDGKIVYFVTMFDTFFTIMSEGLSVNVYYTEVTDLTVNEFGMEMALGSFEKRVKIGKAR